MNKKNIIFIISLLILLLILNINNIILFYNIYKVIGHKDNIREIVKTDTTIIVDTMYYSKPIPKIIRIKDTIYIPMDSVTQEGDSIVLPREEKVYEDSTYKAVISGFKPSLDTITVFPRTIYITKEKTLEIEKKTHFNHGIQLGVGWGFINKKPDIFLGYGFQYNF